MDGMVTPLVQPRERLLTPRTVKPGLRPVLLLAASAIHAALIAAFCLLINHRPAPPPPPEPGVPMVFAPPPAATTALATATLQPPALPVIASLANVPPIAIIRGATPPHPRPKRQVPVRSAIASPALTSPSSTVPAPAPATAAIHPPQTATPQPVAPAALAGWEARIRQAVQDAAIYPASARLQRRQGRTQVQFAYADGTVSTVMVVRSSESAVLDAAALAAVTRAQMPSPPPDLGPQHRTMLVWVQFTLTAED
jgi:protein TonB